MTTESIPLASWLERATLEQRQELYEAANTSRVSAWQMANSRFNMSPAKAAEIETATIAIHQKAPLLPPVLRTTSCAVCAACPHAKCQGDAQ